MFDDVDVEAYRRCAPHYFPKAEGGDVSWLVLARIFVFWTPATGSRALFFVRTRATFRETILKPPDCLSSYVR